MRDLKRVTDLQLDLARQKLARVAERDSQILEQIAGIDAQVQAMFHLAVDDPFQQAGAGASFEQWASRRRSELQMDRARLRVERATAMGSLRLAFGRAEAVRLTSRDLR